MLATFAYSWRDNGVHLFIEILIIFAVAFFFFFFFFFFAVSGFYAECPSKKVCFNVHIWTKSKFYGMSIGVVNHGEGEENLDHTCIGNRELKQGTFLSHGRKPEINISHVVSLRFSKESSLLVKRYLAICGSVKTS